MSEDLNEEVRGTDNEVNEMERQTHIHKPHKKHPHAIIHSNHLDTLTRIHTYVLYPIYYTSNKTLTHIETHTNIHI